MGDIPSGQREQMAQAIRPVPRDFHRLLPLLTDTHNHMAGYGKRSRKQFNKEMMTIQSGGVMHAREYCVVSVVSEDWDSCKGWLQPAACQAVSLRHAIGIHPQCANNVKPESGTWLHRMRAYLEAAPWALVGEIGLDRNTHFKP